MDYLYRYECEDTYRIINGKQGVGEGENMRLMFS